MPNPSELLLLLLLLMMMMMMMMMMMIMMKKSQIIILLMYDYVSNLMRSVVNFLVSTATTLKATIFWILTHGILRGPCRRFSRHLSKSRHAPTRLHNISSQTTTN